MSIFAVVDGLVSLSSDDMQGLKPVWMALGMTALRADEILAPAVG